MTDEKEFTHSTLSEQVRCLERDVRDHRRRLAIETESSRELREEAEKREQRLASYKSLVEETDRDNQKLEKHCRSMDGVTEERDVLQGRVDEYKRWYNGGSVSQSELRLACADLTLEKERGDQAEERERLAVDRMAKQSVELRDVKMRNTELRAHLETRRSWAIAARLAESEARESDLRDALRGAQDRADRLAASANLALGGTPAPAPTRPPYSVDPTKTQS